MRLAPFFLLSVAFHAAILTLPVSLFQTRGEQMIPVTLIAVGDDEGQGPAAKGSKGVRSIPRATLRRDHAEFRREIHKTGAETPAEGLFQMSLPRRASEDMQTRTAVWGAKNGAEEGGTSDGLKDGGGGKGKLGGTGNGGLLTGSGEEGDRKGPLGWSVTQADYAYNPKPEYPERARKEGWEGTVLLRVLVDQEGKSKWAEVSRSSGFETLDQAALKTVKGWRFHPARYGENKVESWVRIPIIFRLAEIPH